ncbi:tetraspanin-16-like isoform X3 [Alosa alosa]|uniref:tetraspanin-16-like isoform X3 n=1 Tax=Alosa alosa TaxID=278164 RepID=UPI0020150F06|nr:tetraspanin-16-like isoform X3 [Alosa alosa]
MSYTSSLVYVIVPEALNAATQWNSTVNVSYSQRFWLFPKKGSPQKSKMSRLQNLYSVMKYLMMILSGIILISGFVVLGVGIWINIGTNNFVKSVGDFSSQLGIISTVCTVAGAGLSLLGFIGCYGAWAEKRTLILVVEDFIRKASKETLLESYKGPTAQDGISVGWNAIMTTFKCCGVENSTLDFVGSTFTNVTGLLYPKTCCVDMEDPSCDGLDTTPSLLHPDSCDVKMIFTKSQSLILGSTAAVICVLELGSMMISAALYVRLGHSAY